MASRGIEQLTRGPGVWGDLSFLEGGVVHVFDVPDWKIERKVGTMGRVLIKLAALEIMLHQVDAEAVPLAFAHAHAVTSCLAIGEHICGCTWCVVIAYDTKREQAIAIVTLLAR